MIRPSQARRNPRRARCTALLALATVAAVLVPPAPPAGAATNSVVTVTAHEDWVYEGATASFTFTADPVPTADLTVTYNITEQHNTHGGNGSDRGVMGQTIIIPAGQSSAVLDIGLRKDMQFRWAPDTDAKKYKLNGNSFGPFCKNSAKNGKPYHDTPDQWDSKDRENAEHFADWPEQALHPDYACSEKLGQIAMLHSSTIGSIGVLITGVGSGGSKGSSSYDATGVRDRSLWTERLTIAESSGDTTVAENGGTDTYTVALTVAPSHNVTVTAKSANPAAATVKTTGAAAASATLTFTPQNWSTPQTVTVTGVDDSVVNTGGKRSANITHAVASSDSRYSGKQGSVTVTVTDDDSAPTVVVPVATVGSTNYTGGEAAGSRSVSVAVSLDSPAPQGGLAVGYTVGGTATAGSDYTALGSSLSIAGGSSSGTIVVTIIDDSDDDDGESITITLNTGNGYSLGTPRKTTITITDNDTGATPGVTISKTSVIVAENSGEQDYTVVLDSRPAGSVTVRAQISIPNEGYAARVGSKTDGQFSAVENLTFTAQNWSTPQTVTVRGVDDNVDNPGDKRTATISHTITSGDGDGYTSNLAVGSVDVEVSDDDGSAPTVVVPVATVGSTNYTGGEAAGSRSVSVAVSLDSPAPQGGLAVGYTVGGTATAGSDYTALGSSLSIAGGSSSGTIVVTIIDDSDDDDGESITITLNTGNGYSLGTPRKTTITITDNDTPAPIVDDNQQDNPQQVEPSTPSTDTSSSSSSNGGRSSGQTVRPVVDLTLGDGSQDSIALGESSEMTVELERSVSSIVRVFIEIDSTAVLGTDYTVDADVGDGWVSLGDNPRRVVFDLPRRDTDAAIRVTSLDTSTTDTTITLTITIGDRSFAGGSVVTIRPQGTAEVVSLGDPDAAPAESDDGPGGDGQDPSDGTGTTEADPETDGDGTDQDDTDTGSDDTSTDDGSDTDDDGTGSDGDATETADDDGTGSDGDATETADDDGTGSDGDSGAADAGHAVDPGSLGTVTQTDDGYFVLYTVRPGDTLSGIALTFYRDDEAWRRIFAANRGRRMSDGYTFASADMIRAGWVLRVPLPIAAPSSASAAKMAYVTYCVMRGDMLSGIAHRIYGDGSLYNRIVLANRGQRQANGQTFVHGDRIAPGWQLRIPIGG